MTLKRLYGIVGAGGFGREIMPYAVETVEGYGLYPNWWELVFVEREDRGVINGHRCISEDEFFGSGAELYFNISIADYMFRRSLADRFMTRGAKPFSVWSDSVIRNGYTICEGSVLCGGFIVCSNAHIGRFFHGNIQGYVAHDCVIGDFVTFAPHVCCNGHVVVQDYAYVGTGAMIKQGTEGKPITIGQGAVVGMGAVVLRDVAPFTTVVGNPAAEMGR